MVLLCGEAQVEPLSVCLEIVLILMQDRCTVCAEHTIFFWTHPMELLGDVCRVESLYVSFKDSVSVNAR
jgi:hypothetical protein